jgi:hypothetical protein
MSKIRYNKSKTYLLPLLSEIVGFDKRFFTHLHNVYMFEDTGEYKDCLLILHDFSFKIPEFTAYEHNMINNDLFVKLIDIDDKVLYIFKFPNEYMHEYECLKDGKYSLFKDDAKELILDFFTDIYKGNPNAVPFLIKVKQILFKDEKLKKEIEESLSTERSKVILPKNAELNDPIEIIDETFNLSQYIKKDENKNKEITPSS